MDDRQFDELIGVLKSIAGGLEKIAEYLSDEPGAEQVMDSFGYLKRIAEALEYGKY